MGKQTRTGGIRRCLRDGSHVIGFLSGIPGGSSMSRRRFDWIVDSTVESDPLPWNIPVREAERFVAVPSKGSLVPGWVLVVPRQRVLNLWRLPDAERDELNDFCKLVRRGLN